MGNKTLTVTDGDGFGALSNVKHLFYSQLRTSNGDQQKFWVDKDDTGSAMAEPITAMRYDTDDAGYANLESIPCALFPEQGLLCHNKCIN